MACRVITIGSLHVEFPEFAAGIIFTHLHFLLNDRLFTRHLVGVQGTLANVGKQQIQGLLPVFGGRRDIVASAVKGSRGIGHPAQPFESFSGFLLREGTS